MQVRLRRNRKPGARGPRAQAARREQRQKLKIRLYKVYARKTITDTVYLHSWDGWRWEDAKTNRSDAHPHSCDPTTSTTHTVTELRRTGRSSMDWIGGLYAWSMARLVARGVQRAPRQKQLRERMHGDPRREHTWTLEGGCWSGRRSPNALRTHHGTSHE